MLTLTKQCGCALMIAAAGMTWNGSALAQSLAECRQIVGDAERLACYDRLPAAEAPAAMGALISPATRNPTDPALAAAERAIRGQLHDPASARFVGVQQRGDAVCGFVNAKSASGGYTGSKLFVYVTATGERHVLDRPSDAPSAEAAYAAYAAHCR